MKKVTSSESGEKYAQIKQYLQVNALQNSFNHNMLVNFNVRGQQGMDFFLTGSSDAHFPQIDMIL